MSGQEASRRENALAGPAEQGGSRLAEAVELRAQAATLLSRVDALISHLQTSPPQARRDGE
jgi:hypothetical protein